MYIPKVTIVVSPRERFSFARQSLESIYKHTQIPFRLVYVDGNSPAEVQQYLLDQAQQRQFQLIRTEYYLSPNRARNLGLALVETPYVAFVDNDVIVADGWLSALIDCAEKTGATIVGPLMCQDEPVHETIHFAGGESRIIEDVKGRRLLREKMYKQGQKLSQKRFHFQRMPTELCEFHCMLVRRDIFDQVGFFDEAILNTKEHLDFCIIVAQAGGTVYFEPESLVTYVPGTLKSLADFHYYMLRWSDAWELASLGHLRQKWNLAENTYFTQRYKALGWRRRQAILLPLVRRLTLGVNNQLLEKVMMYGLLAPLEKTLNRYLTYRYAKSFSAQASQPTTLTPPSPRKLAAAETGTP
ncbi:MAG: glycosyltransferase [Chloroflexaceae bacterium]|nr:glycosyltransferase [Chloroflexaceae bacterium]